jgi:mRNA interferase RelE/StbE
LGAEANYGKLNADTTPGPAGACLCNDELRMPYEMQYSRTALQQLKRLRAFEHAAILEQIEKVLGVNPTLESKARVKRLQHPAPTQYRLRVGEFRVFYDVEAQTVHIVQILSKEDAIRYLGESS